MEGDKSQKDSSDSKPLIVTTRDGQEFVLLSKEAYEALAKKDEAKKPFLAKQRGLARQLTKYLNLSDLPF
ncbi:hypothetical protein C4553_00760 [Candidatus Parcubacteria bacterium]|nr:MAG: hypothetical protein C4553_00760 [Candidatus Parcubacteria bacterium]